MAPDPASLGPGASRAKTWPWAAALGVVASLWFGLDLPSEPRFVDESAYLSQTYYADLLLDGRFDAAAWLDYGAIDLPPLPKYLFGLALRAAGHPRYSQASAHAWYANPARCVVGSNEDLWLARWTVVPLGALGCVAAFAIGTMAFDRRVGLVAGLLLMLDPLYGIHCRRAMADVPCECFVLASAAVGLCAWRSTLSGRSGWIGCVGFGAVIGILSGLAVLAKLSGGLALMTLAGQTILAGVLPGIGWCRKGRLILMALIAAPVAYSVFAGLNPMLWARPDVALPTGSAAIARKGMVGRTMVVVEFRADVSLTALGNSNFRKDALGTPIEKLAAVVVQGFGRFGPLGPRKLDSTLRYDPIRDRGGWIWGPLVVIGAICAVFRGSRRRHAHQPPTSWAFLVQFAVVFATVTAFIPLAWDRYMLPIQSVSAILGSAAILAGFDGFVRSLGGMCRRDGVA